MSNVENLSSNHAHLGKVEYPIVRSKLRAWLVLEDFYSNIIRAAGNGNREDFVSSLYSYISAALSVTEEELKACPWYEVIRAFQKIYATNRPSFDFPLLHDREEKHSIKSEGWEYAGRDWFSWLHLLAKEYGWNIEYIENLDIDSGIALLQEVMISAQQEKEWQWGMSEIAYQYNENTKTSKFVPLERPAWMRPVPKPTEKVWIKASELPIGLVLKWDTDDRKFTRPQ